MAPLLPMPSGDKPCNLADGKQKREDEASEPSELEYGRTRTEASAGGKDEEEEAPPDRRRSWPRDAAAAELPRMIVQCLGRKKVVLAECV